MRIPTLQLDNKRPTLLTHTLRWEQADFAEQDNVLLTSDGVRSIGAFAARQEDVSRVLFAEGDDLYTLSSSGLKRNGELIIEGASGGSMAKLGSTLLYTSPDVGTYTIADECEKVYHAGFAHMCVAGDRAYCTSGGQLYMNETGDADSWTDLTIIDPSEQIDAIVSLKGTVYVLGSTVYRLDTREYRPDSVLQEVARGLGKVQADTVAEVGDSVYFCTAECVYRLTNSSLTRLAKVPEHTDFTGGSACRCRGRYMVCATVNKGGAAKRLTLLLGENGSVQGVFQNAYDALYSREGRVYGVRESTLYELDKETDGHSRYRSGRIILGTYLNKSLLRLGIATLRKLRLTVESEGQSKTYAFDGAEDIQWLRISGHGREFRVRLESDVGLDADCCILQAVRTGRW